MPCESESANTSHCLYRVCSQIHIRRATGDTVLPLSTPIRARDGSVIREVPIPKGTFLILNNLASNTNPAIWGADAHEWKPERWLQPLPKEVENAPIPGVYSHL